MIEVGAPDLLQAPSVIANLALINGQQTLDNARWENVFFLNMQIIYKGGPVGLKNVRFVHCTFTITQDPQGKVVTDYAALEKAFAEFPG